MRILLAYSRPARFVEIDRDLLAELYEVEEYAQPGPLGNPFTVLGKVRRNDVVVVWFASWHAVWPVTLARLLRKPVLLIVGGFDTADMPEIDYGFQQGGVRKLLAGFLMRRASQLMTNSEYSRAEVERNVGIPAARVAVVYHGVPDPFGSLPSGSRDRVALTVSNVARISLERKGLIPFVEAAALAPEIEFVLVGKELDDAGDLLRAGAAANVRITGWLSDEALDEIYRRASVYVQASRHEGFGMSVAEAMLAGCIPVVTRAGALPEVVGDEGVWIESTDPEAVADGVRRGFEAPPEARARARERVLREFPPAARRDGLQRLLEDLLRRRERRA